MIKRISCAALTLCFILCFISCNKTDNKSIITSVETTHEEIVTIPDTTDKEEIVFSDNTNFEKKINLSEWEGQYYYGVGDTAFDSSDCWMVIYQDDERWSADLFASGRMYGIFSQLSLQYIEDSDTIEFTVSKHYYEDLPALYSLGDALFSLHKNEENEIITIWQTMEPLVNIVNQKEIVKDGICFTKSNDDSPIPSSNSDFLEYYENK